MKRRDFIRFLALGAGFSAGLLVPKVFYSIPEIVVPQNLNMLHLYNELLKKYYLPAITEWLSQPTPDWADLLPSLKATDNDKPILLKMNYNHS